MSPARERPTVAIVGAGAAGTLTAVQLCEGAARRRTPLRLVLIDPAPEAGRGTAYATIDPRHRLNVPAGDMSCYPDDPGHFTRWLCRHGEPTVRPADFATRYRYGAYLADTLARAVVHAHGTVAVQRLRTRAEACTRTSDGRRELRLADGTSLVADGVVLATGPAGATAGWAPPRLRASGRFVRAPWAPGALDEILARRNTGARADVLLVGTGLTAVDLALTLDRPDRTVHAVSRTGLLPQPHALSPAAPMAAPDDLDAPTLSALRRTVYRHIGRAVRTHGDWRPALDSLRPHTARLWHSLTPGERAAFLEREGALWNTHRHRMAPVTAESVERARTARRLRLHTGRITGTAAQPDGTLLVTLSDGTCIEAGWVIDCTGPGPRPEDPLWRCLFGAEAAVPGPLGLGVATRDGRLVDASGRTGPALFTLGAPRRGNSGRPPRSPRSAPRRPTWHSGCSPFSSRRDEPPAAVPSTPTDSRCPPTPQRRPPTAADSNGSSRSGRAPRTPSAAPSRSTPASPSDTPRSPCSVTRAAPTSTYRERWPTPAAPRGNGPTNASAPSSTWSTAGCAPTPPTPARAPCSTTSPPTPPTRWPSPQPCPPSPSPASTTSTPPTR